MLLLGTTSIGLVEALQTAASRWASSGLRVGNQNASPALAGITGAFLVVCI
jgi:hypothetical protein